MPSAAAPLGQPTVESEADRESGGDHDGGGERVAGEVGGGPTREHGDLGHGQAAESVDDPVAEVGGQPHSGGAGREGDLHDQDTGEQELDVVLADDGLDEIAEHGGEAEHEHHRHHRGEEERLGRAQEALPVAADDDGDVTRRRSGRDGAGPNGRRAPHRL